MTRALVLAIALSSCAPAHSLARRKPPTWAYALDFAAMSVGACIGLDGWNRNDTAQTWTGYSIALAAWAPYWVTNP